MNNLQNIKKLILSTKFSKKLWQYAQLCNNSVTYDHTIHQNIN